MQLRVLDEATLRRLVDMPSAVAAVRRGFEALWRGEATVPVRTVLETPGGPTLFMPGHVPGLLPGQEALGLKVVSVRPGNAALGRPAVLGSILLVDPATGAPSAVLDAGWLTALRTGAASGVATDLLARPDARVLALVGAGGQARAQVEAVAAVRSIDEVRVVSRGGGSARRLAEALQAEGVVPRARAVDTSAEALYGADVVVTATDSPSPVLFDADVAPGTHVNAVGSYRLDMRELPEALLVRARVVVDDVEAALAEAGEIRSAVDRGRLSVGSLSELGAVAAGDRPGRRSRDEITVFKSVGNAVQDLVVASLALQRAEGSASPQDPRADQRSP